MFSAAGKSAVTSGYNINNSLRLRSSASAYLSRTPASAGNRQIFTWSGWVKRGTITGSGDLTLFSAGTTAPSYDSLRFTNDALQFFQGGGASSSIQTTQLFRDPSAWYHIILAVDTTQATSSNRIKLYVNGSQITALSSSSYPTQNLSANINNNLVHAVGALWITSPQQYFDGYLTEINFIDGSALTPSSFGETDGTTGVWKPKRFGGSFGTNGFYLPFSDIATTSGSNAGLGKDFSGNGNYWTTNNISVTSGVTYDAMLDSPTNTSATVGNYCTWNPLKKPNNGSFSNGNLSVVGSTDTEAFGTMAYPSTGSFYFEYIVASTGGGGFGPQVGICTLDGNYTVKYFRNGYKGINGTNTTYGGSWSLNDVIGIAYNATTNTVTFYKNNVSQGDISATSGYEYFPFFFDNSSSTHNFTFGQRPFTYTPPSGFVTLNTFNLAESTIKKGNLHMDATTYTGTNGSPTTQVISSNFQPDLLWFKKRSAAYDHALIDSVRGINKQLYSNLTNAEGTDGDVLSAIGSTSFTVGNSNYSNYGTLVAWTWKAGGTSTVNTSGSISSNVSVNTTAGFSVVTYTWDNNTSTIGHGLGVKPSMIIVKSRDSSVYNWTVYHSSLGATKQLVLNSTLQALTTSNPWNDTEPNSSVFTIGTNWSDGTTPDRHVAYCWAEIAGFSKFGSYTGNGSTDGTFVYTGFRPKYILIKRTNLSEDWYIYDTSRITYNLGNIFIYADLSDAENTGATGIDILSNGFKQRQTGGGNNASGSTYIYAAYAENPFKNALAR